MKDEDFIKICKESPSMREAARRMGYSESRMNSFKRKAIKLGCYETNQSGKGIPRLPARIPLEEYYSGVKRISSYKLKSHMLREGAIENKCEDCGIESTWNGKELVLHLDHIDGNSYNNKRDNLRLLCPNCHSQTESYCGKKRKNIDLTDEDYIKHIPEAINVAELMKKLNRRPQGHHYRKVAELMEKHDLSFKEGNKLKVRVKTTTVEVKVKNRYVCGNCGNEITNRSESGNCVHCLQISSRTVQRPPYEQLKKELEETSFLAVGKKYGVSDNAIRKWVKYYEKNLDTENI